MNELHKAAILNLFSYAAEDSHAMKNKLSSLCKPPIVMIIVGILGLVIKYSVNLTGSKELLSNVSEEIFIAIFISGLLALTVDTYFKRLLSRDVFEAALGYVLPDSLKDDIRWILDTNFISPKSYIKFDLAKHDTNTVDITVSTERYIKNIGKKSQKYKTQLGVDDFGQSSISICSMEHSGIVYSNNGVLVKGGEIYAETQEIDLEPGKEVKILYKFTIRKRHNDEFFWFFNSHTEEIILNLNIDNSLYDTNVNFATVATHSSSKFHFSQSYLFRGSLLATQPIHIRWWPKHVSV